MTILLTNVLVLCMSASILGKFTITHIHYSSIDILLYAYIYVVCCLIVCVCDSGCVYDEWVVATMNLCISHSSLSVRNFHVNFFSNRFSDGRK